MFKKLNNNSLQYQVLSRLFIVYVFIAIGVFIYFYVSELVTKHDSLIERKKDVVNLISRNKLDLFSEIYLNQEMALIKHLDVIKKEGKIAKILLIANNKTYGDVGLRESKHQDESWFVLKEDLVYNNRHIGKLVVKLKVIEEGNNRLIHKYGLHLTVFVCSIIFISLISFIVLLRKKTILPIMQLSRKIETINNTDEPLFLTGTNFSELDIIVGAINAMQQRISRQIKMFNQIEQDLVATKVARQVAHDIRSPLSALNMMTQDLKPLPEDQRIIIRSAVQRIEDIANDLASKKDQEKVSWPSAQDKTQNLQTRLLPSLLSSLISEKRIEYRTEKSIAIEADFGSESYGLFANVQTKEFKRIISNLINNAIEAMEGNGEIKISLASSPSTSSGSNNVYRPECSDKTSDQRLTTRDMIVIAITDNGKGIPQEILPKLMQKGVSFGKEKSKKSGSGLGLYHAKETIESWGGKIIIESKVDYGTAVTIFLPKQASPDWFLPEISIQRTMKNAPRIVILDDDESIHRVWDTRFNEVQFSNENIYHFYSPDQIINWYTSKKLLLMKAPMLVLCDYELLDCEKTGLQVIEELGIEKNVVLVTSHYDEIHIRNNCARLGVKLLPKNLAGFVPISVIEKDEKTINENLEPKTDQNCDAILIDDDYLVHTSWKIIAKRYGKTIRCYADPADFISDSKEIDKTTPLYIDSNLSDDVKGEVLAKEFFDKGFENIYLATGYAKEDFPKMPWIKGIVGKEPPFLAS